MDYGDRDIETNPAPRTKPAALFDPEGRRRLAELIVWEDRPTARPRSIWTIQTRIVEALERIAASMEDENEKG